MNTNTGLDSHSSKNPGGRIRTARFVKRGRLACYMEKAGGGHREKRGRLSMLS